MDCILEELHLNGPYVLMKCHDIIGCVGLEDKDGHFMRSRASFLDAFVDFLDLMIEQLHILPWKALMQRVSS